MKASSIAKWRRKAIESLFKFHDLLDELNEGEHKEEIMKVFKKLNELSMKTNNETLKK